MPRFKYCTAKKYVGVAGRLAGGISLQECCREHSEVVDQIKKIPGADKFFERRPFSSDFYLQGKEAELLFTICNFGVNESSDTTLEKIGKLKEVLILEGILAQIHSFVDTLNLVPEEPTENSIPFFLPPFKGDGGADALQKAKLFEKKYKASIRDKQAYAEALENYTKAAKLGNEEAINWLRSVAISDSGFTSGHVCLTLGDIYSEENAPQQLINPCYQKAWEILFDFAQQEWPEAIEILYGRSVGEKSASEIKQTLDDLLLYHIKNISSKGSGVNNNERSQQWILSIFASSKLPPFYVAHKEKALLTLVQTIEWDSANKFCASYLFRENMYDEVRSIVEIKLNELLQLNHDPIALKYFASSLDHETYVIHPMYCKDSARFTMAVQNCSALASFFSPNTKLASGQGFSDCLKLNKVSWGSFKRILMTEQSPWELYKLLSEGWSQDTPHSNLALFPKEIVQMIIEKNHQSQFWFRRL